MDSEYAPVVLTTKRSQQNFWYSCEADMTYLKIKEPQCKEFLMFQVAPEARDLGQKGRVKSTAVS